MGQCAHLRYYATNPDCEVVALAEPKSRLAEGVARKYGVAHRYNTAEEMLTNERLDGIVAIQPFGRHGQLIEPLYRHRIPILTEKPIAHSVEIGEKLLAAMRSSDVMHMVAYHKRSDPATIHAKEEIDRLKVTGELGQLRYVRITMPPGDWTAEGFYDLVRTDEPNPSTQDDPAPSDLDHEAFRKYIGFVNYYIHQVNLLRHLLGESYRVSFADRAGVLFAAETASGATGLIEMAPYNTSRDWQESALVCFEKGWVKIELPPPVVINQAGRVTIFRDPGNGATPTTITPVMPSICAMRQQAANFIGAIRGENKPPCDAAEALEDLKAAREYMRLSLGQ